MPKKLIGILTAGGDCPGLNAAIRAVGKAAYGNGMEVIGFLDGFRGLVENRTMRLDPTVLSGILTSGGTLLGTSRDKPHRMPVGGKGVMDMTPVAVDNYRRLHLDVLVCLGGNGTQKNAYRLMQEGLNIVTLPKTIDNDVAKTEVTFGFDTALAIATDAVDRLHTTADSHHRVILLELMGHSAGWLALGAGIAGGADVILIPEIPYQIDIVIEALINRYRSGKRFSIVAVAEGARAVEMPASTGDEDEEPMGSEVLAEGSATQWLAQQIEERSHLETRATVLGHVQRGGTPTPTDRLLATRLGTKAAQLIADDIYNVMVAVKRNDCVPVKLKGVAGKLRNVPLDHPWIQSARQVGTCLGDGVSI
ncbi:MAG: 6-phosphofructokinase [Anaerolineae bacterium]|nr:6-phosphofructokinase [Anaerolineae bacterium]